MTDAEDEKQVTKQDDVVRVQGTVVEALPDAMFRVEIEGGLEVLARGPVYSNQRPQNVEYTSTIYQAAKGNWVFNAATIWWADGLSEPPGYLRPTAHGSTPPGPDPRVQRATENLFARFLT